MLYTSFPEVLERNLVAEQGWEFDIGRLWLQLTVACRV